MDYRPISSSTHRSWSDYITNIPNITINYNFARQFAEGFFSGYTVSHANNIAATIKQGKNYSMAIPMQLQAVAFTVGNFGRFVDATSLAGRAKLVLKAGSQLGYFFVLLPFSIAAGMYKSGAFERYAAVHNDIIKIIDLSRFLRSRPRPKANILTRARITVFNKVADGTKFLSDLLKINETEPTPDSRRAKVLNFLAEHMGDAAQAAAMAIAVGMILVGYKVAGVVSLVMMGLSALDRKGYLPMRVSVFYNTKLNSVANGIGIILGNPVEKFFAVINTVISLSTGVLKLFRNNLDRFVLRLLAPQGITIPTLHSLQPTKIPDLTESRPNLSIMDVLNFNEDRLLVNPTHAKYIGEYNPDISKAKYADLVDLFQGLDLNNESTFANLERQLLNDSDWKDYVQKKELWEHDVKIKAIDASHLTPGLTVAELDKDRRQQFEEAEVIAKAELEAQRKEYKPSSGVARKAATAAFNTWDKKAAWKKLVIDWSIQRMKLFVQNISFGDSNGAASKRPQGSLEGYREIQKDCKKVIVFIQDKKAAIAKLADKTAQRIEGFMLEDFLIRFAIDGGDHCVQGIERAVRENLAEITRNGQSSTLAGTIYSVLARKRRTWFEGFMRGIMSFSKLYPGFKDLISNMEGDIHYYNESVRAFGDGLGLDMTAARRDNTVQIGPLAEAIQPIMYPHLRYSMWLHAYKITDRDDPSGIIAHASDVAATIKTFTNTIMGSVGHHSSITGVVKQIAAAVLLPTRWVGTTKKVWKFAMTTFAKVLHCANYVHILPYFAEEMRPHFEPIMKIAFKQMQLWFNPSNLLLQEEVEKMGREFEEFMRRAREPDFAGIFRKHADHAPAYNDIGIIEDVMELLGPTITPDNVMEWWNNYFSRLLKSVNPLLVEAYQLIINKKDLGENKPDGYAAKIAEIDARLQAITRELNNNEAYKALQQNLNQMYARQLTDQITERVERKGRLEARVRDLTTKLAGQLPQAQRTLFQQQLEGARKGLADLEAEPAPAGPDLSTVEALIDNLRTSIMTDENAPITFHEAIEEYVEMEKRIVNQNGTDVTIEEPVTKRKRVNKPEFNERMLKIMLIEMNVLRTQASLAA
jgi:hypothetical protein